MRIILVSTELVGRGRARGGLAHHVQRVSLALARVGHEVTVVGLSDRHAVTADEGVTVVEVPSRPARGVDALDRLTLRRLNHGLSLLDAGRRLNLEVKRLLGSTGADVVQYTHLGGVAGLRPDEVATTVRVSSATSLCRKAGGYDGFGRFAVWQQERLELWGCRRADAVFAPSRFVADALRADTGLQVEVVQPPFFLETERRDDRLLRERVGEARFLLFVGTLNRLKGVPVLATALARLLAEDRRLRAVLVGREEAAANGLPMMELVRRAVGAHADRLVHLEGLEHRELYPFYAGAAVVALPSLIDNLPNTLLEAMAHGAPVVGTRGASFDELIDDGATGFLVNRGDPEDLLAGLRRALALGESQRRELGRRAQARIAMLAPEHTLPRLESVFEGAMCRHRARRSRGA